MGWSPPAEDAVWTPPASDAVSPEDTSDAPPSAGMPSTEDRYRQFYFGGGQLNANGKPGPMEPIPQDALDEFTANPPSSDVAKNFKHGASALTGLPKVAAAWNPVTPVLAAFAGGLGGASGILDAAADVVGNPDDLPNVLPRARERMRAAASGVYTLADYMPSKLATKEGNQLGDTINSLPGAVAKNINDNVVRPIAGDNVADTFGDIGQDVGTLLPGLGVRGLARGAAGVVGKAAKGASDFVKSEAASVSPPGDVPSEPLKPDVGSPVTAESLRAAPNPIPPPDGTVAAAKEAARAPQQTATPPENATPQPRLAAGETAPVGDTTLPATDSAPLDMSLSPDQRALVREGVAARRRASDNAPESTQSPGDTQRGSVRLFNEPAKEGPQETPDPSKQSERAASLDAIDKLSGGGLPSRRASAISGDYNATGDDYQMKEVGSEPMRQQIASENAALHTAMENVHDSVGSQFPNSVDSITLGDRARVTRGAVQAIEKHFNDRTDEIYTTARAQNQGRAMPRPARVSAYLNDDSNFTNDAEQGLQRAAKQRMERLWTTGDPDSNSPAGSINGAERLREFLNEKGKNPQAMGVARDLKNHLDMDVAEQGGPGLFESARAMRRHSYQMMEEPSGIKKLLAPADSQGINHAIPEHKVMDYIADLPREQHEQVLNVLRAGAHLDPELAKTSAAALREIQGHTISRIHAAATNADGTWNARKYYNAADRYARNMPETFKGRPDIASNLKTINDAGNTLSMDKHYPGAIAQGERTGALGHVLSGAGNLAASVAHEIPVAGRMIGRTIERGVERAKGEMSEANRDKIATSRLVDRNGKQRGSVQLFNDNPLNRENEERTTFHGKDINPRNERNERTANQQIGGQRPLTDEQNDILRRLSGEPLGARVGGGKQRGAVGDLSQRDAIEHKEVPHADEGAKVHRYTVPGNGGTMNAVERSDLGVTQGKNVNIVNKGNGWGTRTLQRAVDDTHARGQVWHSDDRVSDGQAGAYSNLKKLGYDVRTKPNDHVQGEYKAVGDHVFEVRPPKGYEAPDELKNGKDSKEVK